ncbi:MAG: hypothetical protein GY810_12095 [Aureispira sp.]|nr:hypothetical protein [Aureispira sp.]
MHYFYEYNRRVHVFKGPAPLVVVTKPIIYLYPEKSCEVIVKLDYKNNLTILYPKFNIENGWTIKAQPDGRLIDPTTQKEYYGLYWEGDSDKVFDLSTGFVVKGEKSADFLDKKLAQLGLSRREANEFIVYWLPRMEKNKYNLIHFAQEEYRSLAQLKISPKPQTLIRVFMVLQPLDKTINVPQQDLPTIERKGFTVVEWGGTEYPKRREYE